MDQNTKNSWRYFLRQLLVCSGVWTSFFIYGLCVGSPTVFIPQIRREANSTAAISDEMASWLTSVIGFSAFPCVIIITILSTLLGRKISFIIACVDTFIAFIVYLSSMNVTQILISEILQGLFSAAQIVISVMIITEYTSPKYRGIFLTIKTATFYWGIWAANAIGTFFHYKNIGIVGILLSGYTLATVLMWPESPYWLASKGKYEQCAASHRWLKGCDDESKKELEELITSQQEYIKSGQSGPVSLRSRIRDLYKSVTLVDFYKPTLIAMLTGFLSTSSGKLICTVYAIDIIRKITNSESTAYTAMLILDGITVASMYGGCVLSKYVSRRKMLLVSSTITVIFLFAMSLYLYLIQLSIIWENKYVSVSLLMFFSIAVSCGPLMLSMSMYGELVPIRSRNLAICFIALTGKLCFGVSLKIAPYVFKCFGLHGAFLFYGASSSVCILLLYKYLPETKDKTLQEIADSIRGKKKSNHLDEGLNLVPTVNNNNKTI